MNKLSLTYWWKEHQAVILIAFLVIFHTVGIIGLQLDNYRETFLGLSFMNLVISFAILVISRKTKKQLFYVFLFLCFLTGMVVEWIGIHTGWLFGDYAYGENLGVKFYGVPWIIGINWGVLSVCACTIAGYLPWKTPYLAVCSALLMTLLDFLLEPVAIESDYWRWNTPEIPIYNYICWFLIAVPLHFVYFRWKLREQNSVPIALFIILGLFFVILNFR